MSYLLRILAVALLTSAAFADTSLNGAGATFPYSLYSKWFNEYHKKRPDVQINYQSIGSGGGIRQVINGTVDFGATDGPMTDAQLSQANQWLLGWKQTLIAELASLGSPREGFR